MVAVQGDVWWTALGAPIGSEPEYRRPVVIVQADALNRSRIATVLCVPLTSNLLLAEAPGNVILRSRATGLPEDSVANVSQIVAVDRKRFLDRVGHLSASRLATVFDGIDVVLGRRRPA